MTAGHEQIEGKRLTNRATSAERSAIRLMFDLAQQVETDRKEDLIHLEIGEPDFDTPTHIAETAHEAIREGKTHYTSNAGLPALRTAISDRTHKKHGYNVDPTDEVMVTTGAMEALYLAMASVVDPGDEVIIPTPAWPNYDTQVRLADAKPVEIALPAESGFALKPGRIVDAMSDQTAAVVLGTPSNPTGQVYDQAAVRTVIEAAVEHDAFIVADEVYSDLLYGDYPTGIAGYTDHFERVLTVESCSKTYAMTGWRVGWLAGPADVVDAATKLRESTTACTSSISQHAAIAALTGPHEPVADMKTAFTERRSSVVERVETMAHTACPEPEGAFYAFLDVSSLPGSSLDVAKRLLYDYGVVVTPGVGFGDAGRGYIRLSFANSLERITTGLDRIETMLADEAG